MNAVTFDTLKFARTLQAEGRFTAEQSSSLVEALGDVLARDLVAKSDLRETEQSLKSDLRETELGLKSNLRETELRLKSDLRETELRLEARIAEVKADLVKWLFGAVGVQTLVILGAVFALARLAR